jgi:hypothetical protein
MPGCIRPLYIGKLVRDVDFAAPGVAGLGSLYEWEVSDSVRRRATPLTRGAPSDLRVRRAQEHVEEQPDERDEQHDDRPGRLRRARQVAAAEDIDDRSHPKDEKERDRRNDQDPNEHAASVMRSPERAFILVG